MDCSLSGSFVHGIFQARVLEWVAIPSPGDLPEPRIEPRSPALQADALPSEPPGKPDERERYIQLNAEFQRIARRDDKVFFNKQCIKLEENNRRGMTRDLFRKIGNIMGTFQPKMGTIKDRNDRDLVEAEEIKKRWHKYIERLYKRGLNDPDNHNGVATHLEPAILEYEVK